ncbi:Anaphase-promoting complex subunit 1 [Lunasporangiospora selenospora]|uniref:Anaphase-promoting complex subunit 1 n=1 Tax=Lunasporangiospora selenospora TaxID=979761 RepID=A0A9P6KDX0_9FUNG|nr:Anaphase-promoting complex subunit 1 [Lunasporangiospora selenospora]
MILKIGVKDEGEISAEDLKATHQEILRKAAQRTLALPAGRAILTFGTATALPTQRWSIPSIILSAKLMPAYGMTELEMAVLGDEEYMNWPRFHNGVAAGLRISPNSKGVNSSWINYNRPEVPTNEHAGFLLALGLTGHLRMLERSSVVEYLTKTKHDMTRIGLLLGLAGSFCGTMDSRVNKILSLYVIAFMTPDINLSTIDLNLSTTTEIAGILGIGLNYMETAHRQKAEVMLREIGRVTADSTDSVNDLQECYSLAAGFALGFITLGQGVKATELRDLKIESVLTSYMHGNKDGAIQGGLSTGSSQIGGADEPNRRQTGNDMTSAGATIALALMYLKTNSKTIAEKLNVPETLFLLEYVTPDALILRVICRSLVLWDSIEPTNEWIQSQLPNCLKSPTEGPPVSEAAQQWYYAILAGSCFAMGLRFAGSGNEYAYECILSLFDMFFDLGRQSGDGSYEAAITISTVKTCMDVASLAAAMVVAGSGRVDFLRRMRKLHKRIKGDTTYGSHLASHMAMGLLFLGGGGYTLGTSNRCVASLLCSLYPRLPFDATDNRYHLQAFRHLWVMAVEPRCLVTRDVNTGVCCPVPVRVHLKPDFCHTRNQLEMSRRSSNAFSILPLPVPATADDSMISSRHGETPVYYPTSPLEMMTPCLLPELTAISTIEILGPRYWPITLDLGKVSDRNKISLILQSRTIPVMRHIGHLSYTDDPMGMRSILARPFPKVLTDEDFAILARDRTSDGGARRRKRARMDLISANSRLLKQLRRKHTPSPTSDARSLMLSGDWEEETEQVDQISASFGEDFSLTFLQDPQVGAFASYLCRIHGGTTMMAKDEVMAVYFTHVLNECLTMDKVDALGPHIWLYEISNRLDSYDELSWRTLRELRILLKYYETQRKRRIGHNSTHTQGGSTGIGSPTLGGDLHPGTGHVGRTTRRPSVSATAPTMSSMAKVLEDDGSETLVKVSRIAEMYSKIEKRVNQFLAKGQDLTTLSQEVDGNESQEEGNVGITFEDVTMYFVNGTFPNIDSGQSLSRIPIGIKALRGTFGTRKRVGTDWFKAWLEVNEIPGPDTQAAWAPHVYNPDRTTRSSVMAANRPVSTDTTPSGTASSVASGSGTSSVLSTPPPPLPGSSKQDPESYLLQQVFSVAFPTLNLAVLDYVLASIEEEL